MKKPHAITMKQTLALLAPLLLASAISLVAADADKASVPGKPNILFILTDDQGYGDLGRHGHPILKTPNLDRLHDESVRFDNFYVSASCSPTRAALMTGMHEFNNGVTHTVQPREHLSLDAVLLPQLLKAAGYATGIVGKWHLGDGNGYSPTFRGFDWQSGNVGGSHRHFDPDIVRNGVRRKAQGFREDLFFDEAMAFIEEKKDTPFFCYLATFSPHTPLAAPEQFIAPYRGKVSEDAAKYLGMVANIDYNVGRILGRLEHLGIADKTIVVFMNDNGATMGLDLYNAGMRGCKCTIWQGGRRAMSFWRWPGRWKPHVVGNLTAHLDVLPTFCDLAGAAIPAELQSRVEGFSLRPLLETAGPISWREDRMLFHHVARWPSGMAAAHKYAMAGVRQGDYLLVRSHSCNHGDCAAYVSQCGALRSVAAGGRSATYTPNNAQFHWGVTPPERWALFNVRQDPACGNDLALTTPETTAKLAAAYDRWWDNIYPRMIAAGGDKGEPWKRGESLQQQIRKDRSGL